MVREIRGSFVSSNAVVVRVRVLGVTVTALQGSHSDGRSKVGWLRHDGDERAMRIGGGEVTDQEEKGSRG